MSANARASRIVAGVVALAAGVSSFAHIVSVTRAAGEGPLTSLLYPIFCDGPIVVGSLAMIEDRRNGGKTGWSGRIAFLIGFAATLAANIASAEPNLWSQIWAALPVVSFLAAVEVIVRRGRTPAADAQEPAATATQVLAEPGTAASVEPRTQTVGDRRTAPAVSPRTPPPPSPRTPHEVGVRTPTTPPVRTGDSSEGRTSQVSDRRTPPADEPRDRTDAYAEPPTADADDRRTAGRTPASPEDAARRDEELYAKYVAYMLKRAAEPTGSTVAGWAGLATSNGGRGREMRNKTLRPRYAAELQAGTQPWPQVVPKAVADLLAEQEPAAPLPPRIPRQFTPPAAPVQHVNGEAVTLSS